MSNDFLFELGCEELPSAAVGLLADELGQLISEALTKAKINFARIIPFASPRRIALLIEKIDEQQPEQNILRRGPALAQAFDDAGNPTPALKGFAKSCGVDLSALSRDRTEKGEWIIYSSKQPGAKVKDLLPTMIEQMLSKLPIAKPMRWGDSDIEFARPIHWLLLLWNNEVIDTTILGHKSSMYSYGHRFLYPQALLIKHPSLYEETLYQAKVIASFCKRKDAIKTQIQALAEEIAATAIIPENLLNEVASIVEWPAALIAHFHEDYLQVPAEALIAAMQVHQKCFALKDQHGKLLAHFITISNIESKNAAQVIAGNEKVMNARLSDADFFYKQDKKQPLARYLESTAKVIFQAKLGSLLDKSLRLQTIMESLIVPFALDREDAMRAAELSKCDLMTGMVGEFPELQGLMGYYYAQNDGEKKSISIALNEQYLPRFAADELPDSPLGLALSLADRIDTLVGIFAIGQKPTGVKDPFKLRRHALAVARMLIHVPSTLSIKHLLQLGLDAYGDLVSSSEGLVDEISAFIFERVQSFYVGQGVGIELIQAVKARQTEQLYDFGLRVQALVEFVHRPEAAFLAAACKRVSNILQPWVDQKAELASVKAELFIEKAEEGLYTQLIRAENLVTSLQEKSNYSRILESLAALKEPIDVFFEHVMVMVEDQNIKKNRLALLMRLQSLLQMVADISLLQMHHEDNIA